jgi:hypothetical protein
MVSSGIHLGAWDYLQWKHIHPIRDENGAVIAGKLCVYAGDIEEYYSFITTESYIIAGKTILSTSKPTGAI